MSDIAMDRLSRSVSSDSVKSKVSVPSSISRSRSKSKSKSREKRKLSNSKSRSRSKSPSRHHHRHHHKRHRHKHRSRSRSRSQGRHRSAGRRPRRDSRSRSHSPMSGRRRHLGDRERPPECKCLGVFGLSLNTTDRDMRDIFGKYGPLDSANVVYDKQSGRSRGFGFVYFKDVHDAVEAKMQCAGMEVDGRTIRVDYSITQRAHTPTPGVYLGRPNISDRGFRGGRRTPEPYGRNLYRSRSPSY